MPALHFRVRWPDQTTMDCYSPSTVVKDFFSAGQAYALEDFIARSRTALTRAGDRVEERFGYRCTSADSQLAEIERVAARYLGQDGACVTVEGFLS